MLTHDEAPDGETVMKAKRKANSGSFKKGYDPRRHYLTRAERQRGFASFLRRVLAGTLPSRVSASIRSKIRRYYQAKVRVPVNLETWPVEEPCPF
jgi:hypothetical protein